MYKFKVLYYQINGPVMDIITITDIYDSTTKQNMNYAVYISDI